MAIFHLSAKTLNRRSGRSPQAASAYRRAERLTSRDGVVHDFRPRCRSVVFAEIMTPFPVDWMDSAQTLWDAADAAEKRQDSRTAREYVVGLPAELSGAERIQITLDFAAYVVESFGVAADIAIHEPSGEGDQRNHHAHILTTTRVVKRAGLGEKTAVLDDARTSAGAVDRLREYWAELCNDALARHNIAERVDHRSHEARGLDLVPTKHQGPRVTWLGRRLNQFYGRWLENEDAALENERRASAIVAKAADAAGDAPPGALSAHTLLAVAPLASAAPAEKPRRRPRP